MMTSSRMPPPADKISKNSTATAPTMISEELLNCPRCDSPNTKFCYYNNYSLTQPRHFCKTCRRYWTKGGVLRNVPVGGGCRKSNKSKKSSSHHSSSSSSSSTSSLVPPQFDAMSNFPYYPPIPGPAVYDRHRGGSNIASSIESLSWMNQDLHWKLQQQRLQEMMFGQKQIIPTTNPPHVAEEHSISKKGRIEQNDTTTATTTTASWFLDSDINNTAIGSNSNNSNEINDTTRGEYWNGIPTWSDMHHFTALP